MAHPAIKEEVYKEAFEKLCVDFHPEKITTNQLHLAAGGRYSNAGKVLDRFMVEYRQRQQDQALVPVQPNWFREHVSGSLETFRDQIESQWSVIGLNIEERILEATSKLETERDQLKNKYAEDRSQIELLENEQEELNTQLVEKGIHAATINDQMHDLQSLADHLENVLRERNEQLDRINGQLSEQKSHLSTSERKLETVRSERDTLKGQYSQLQADFKQEKTEHFGIQQTLSQNLEMATSDRLLLETENKHRKEENLELRKQLDQSEKDERQALLDKQAIATTLDIRLKELQEWKDSQLATAKELETAQKELQALQKKEKEKQKQTTKQKTPPRQPTE